MSTTIVYIMFIAFIANLLSVSGLRCHQCNSHDNADCANLLVKTPRAERDNQYLQDCAQHGDQQLFCRKTIIKLDAFEEQRIDRSCGWIEEKTQNACYTADNEGYKQTICTCSGDGCNGAMSLKVIDFILATVIGLSVAFGYVLRH